MLQTTPTMREPSRQQTGNEPKGPTHVRQISGQSFQSTEIYSSRPRNDGGQEVLYIFDSQSFAFALNSTADNSLQESGDN